MAINPTTNQPIEAFLQESDFLSPRGDKLISINISRNTLIAIIFSLIIHALFLSLVVPQIQFDSAAAPLPTTMEVSLAPPPPPKIIEPTPPEPPPEIPAAKVAKPPPKVITQKPRRNVKPAFTVPEVLATPKPSPETVPLEVPVAKENTQDNISAPTDMASYVKARQAQRQALETYAARQNAEAVAREVGPSAEQIREERIKNNFKNGTNGIFEITSLNMVGRRATFTFKGWTNDYSNARRESFEVEASTGQDVRVVMIRRMITLIRQHYQADFNWESQRLRRTVVQSARPEDSAGLEDFMMMEFFGANYKSYQ
ncbi:MAG: hypothetical protein CVU27_03280 [Betaproteobacteria bacterium HGW-Betaproteobacteria-20]|nr:MAG: hypothetical protein CVU27_03280 [Betaproteobacteria bacterium HGW-Betaproteobacteria-20]